jgi:hypothetical protein
MRSRPYSTCSGKIPPCTKTVEPTWSTIGCGARNRRVNGPAILRHFVRSTTKVALHSLHKFLRRLQLGAGPGTAVLMDLQIPRHVIRSTTKFDLGSLGKSPHRTLSGAGPETAVRMERDSPPRSQIDGEFLFQISWYSLHLTHNWVRGKEPPGEKTCKRIFLDVRK